MPFYLTHSDVMFTPNVTKFGPEGKNCKNTSRDRWTDINPIKGILLSTTYQKMSRALNSYAVK